MLPLLDGTSVLAQMRREGFQTPVILITALGALEDKIEGLDLGADDYLVKPFAFEELMARIRSILRRPRKLSDSSALLFGDLAFSTNELSLTGPSGSCTLSGREAALLEAFLRNPGQTLSRELLLTKVWGMDSDVEDGNLDRRLPPGTLKPDKTFYRRIIHHVSKSTDKTDTSLRRNHHFHPADHVLRLAVCIGKKPAGQQFHLLSE